MAEITAKLVKELREKSGAGVMDAKKALVEVEGDIEKAIELLREKGMAKAAKKADRVAAEGLTGVYVNGNVAAVVEVNAETDFVAKNAQFVELVNETAKVIAEGKPANNEEALALTMPSGETLEAAYVTATATIGEKISFRRFAVVEKTDAQHFGAYQHNGGRIGVVSVIEGGDDALAKQISMHIAAMKPTVLSYTELDEQFVKDELAQLNHAIDQDNESRAMVNKPALPHLKYGSKAQLLMLFLLKLKKISKLSWLLKVNQKKSGIKSSQVKWTASCLTTLKLTKHTHFLLKFTSWTTAKQLKLTLNQ